MSQQYPVVVKRARQFSEKAIVTSTYKSLSAGIGNHMLSELVFHSVTESPHVSYRFLLIL